jgi:WD40 repeat protein
LKLVYPIALLICTVGTAFGQRTEIALQTNIGGVEAIAFSPDQKTFASAGTDRTITIWDAEARKQVRKLYLGEYVRAVAYSPDGKSIAGGGHYGVTTMWDVSTGRQIRSFRTKSSFDDTINALTFSPDGKNLAAATGQPYAGGRGCVYIWNVTTADISRVLKDHLSTVLVVTYRPDGKVIASSGWKGTVKLWNSVTGAELRSIDTGAEFVPAIAFSPDGKTIAVAGQKSQVNGVLQGGTLQVLDANSGITLHSLEVGLAGPTYVTFNSNGTILISCGRGGVLKFWDTVIGKELRTISQRWWCTAGPITLSPNDQTLAQVCNGIKLWNITSGKEITYPSAYSSAVSSLAVDIQRMMLAVAGSHGDDFVKIFDLISGREYRTLSGGLFAVFSPDSSNLVVHSSDGQLLIWDVATGKKVRSPGMTSRGLSNVVAFNPNGNILASAGGTSRSNIEELGIALWEVGSWKKLKTLIGHEDIIESLIFSADGKTLASSSWDKTIRLWDISNGKELRVLAGHTDHVTSIAFNPDSTLLVSGSQDNSVKVWDIVTGRLLRSFVGHSHVVSSVKFSPDGRTVASASWDRTIKFWDLRSGRLRRTLLGHSNQINSVAFSRDGSLLFSGSDDATIRIWEVSTGKELGSLIGLKIDQRLIDFDRSIDRLQNDVYDWLIVTPDGLFDGNAEAIDQVSWRMGNTNDIEPLDIFFSDFYYPGLLTDLLAGLRPKARMDISTFFQVPGLRAMVSMGLAEVVKRNGKETLCLKDKPTAISNKINEKLPYSFDLADVVFHQEDPSCPFQVDLSVNGQYDRFRRTNSLALPPSRPAYDGVYSDPSPSTLHVFTVGIGDYSPSESGLAKLPLSAQSARAVQEFFRELALKGEQQNIRVWDGLYDRDATRSMIRHKFFEMARAVKENDVVKIVLSGHGLVPAGQRTFYFAPSDLQGTTVSDLRASGLSTVMICEAIRDLPARRIVLVIDACQSGGTIESLEKVALAKAKGQERVAQLRSNDQVGTQASEVGIYVVAAATPLEDAIQPRVGTTALITVLLSALSQPSSQNGTLAIRDLIKQIERELPITSSLLSQR